VRFERIQSFSEEPVKICPECESDVQRLIQPAGIIFKGSGFYVNDSKSSRKNLNSTTRKDTATETASSKSDDSNSSASSTADD
jgi:putative FmdB family regulatory protein